MAYGIWILKKSCLSRLSLESRVKSQHLQDIALAKEMHDALKPPCEAAEIAVTDDFEVFGEAMEKKTDVLGKCGVILSECVINFCLKVLNNDGESQKEKDKKRGLLISQWTGVQSGSKSMKKELVHPLLRAYAEKYIQGSG